MLIILEGINYVKLALLYCFQSLALLEHDLVVKVSVLDILQRLSKNSGKNKHAYVVHLAKEFSIG